MPGEVVSQLTTAVAEALDAAYDYSSYRWPQQEDCLRIAAALLPTVQALIADAERRAEERGYERGRRDFQFAPEGDNHHNAALCPYCSPAAALDPSGAAEGAGR